MNTNDLKKIYEIAQQAVKEGRIESANEYAIESGIVIIKHNDGSSDVISLNTHDDCLCMTSDIFVIYPEVEQVHKQITVEEFQNFANGL